MNVNYVGFQEQPNRLVIFDIAKALSIYLVVLGHVQSRIDMMVVCGGILFTNMPVFFFISGYFANSSLGKYNLKEFFIRRFKTLFLPFLVWSFISFCANIFFLYIKHEISFSVISEEFVDIFIYARSVWYLIVIFFSEILFGLLYKIFKDKVYIFSFLIWLLLSLLLPSNIFALYKFKWLFPFLIIGAYLSYLGVGFEFRKKNPLLVFIFIIVLLLLVNFFYSKDFFYEYSDFAYSTCISILVGIGYYLISFFAIFTVILLSNLLSLQNMFRRILSFVGKNTLNIYVLHMFLIKFVVFIPTINNIILLNIYACVYSGIIIFLVLIAVSFYRKIINKKINYNMYRQ